MSRLADPGICPDCRAPLDTRSHCTGCGLDLSGAAGIELWQLMLRADALVEAARAGAASTAPATQPSAPVEPVPAAASWPEPFPAAAIDAPAHSPRRLSALSVPVVLLSLGALCVLVAAVVFVAVAWGSLSLAVKTLILLAVTSAAVAAAVAAARRGLRAAAEAIWLIAALLLGLDIAAASSADLGGLGGVEIQHLLAVIGISQVALAVGAGLHAARTPLRRIRGLAATGTLGALIATAAEAWADATPAADAIAVGALAITAAALAAWQPISLRDLSRGIAAVGVLAWWGLIVWGVDRLDTAQNDADWWSGLDGWPLLVAAGYAGAATARGRLALPLRQLCAAGSLLALAILAAGPSTTPARNLGTFCALTAVFGVLAAAGRQPWRLPAAAFAGLAALGAAGFLLIAPWRIVAEVRHDGGAAVRAAVPGAATALPDWGPPLLAVALGIALIGLLPQIRELAGDHGHEGAARALVALGPPVLALGLVEALWARQPTLLAATLAWSLVLVIAIAMSLTVRDQPLPLGISTAFAGYLTATGLGLALAAHALAAGFAAVFAVLFAAAYRRQRPPALDATLPLLAGGAGALAVIAAPEAVLAGDGTRDHAALALALLAAVIGVLAGPLGRTPASRAALELVALAASAAAVPLADATSMQAVALTVAGTAIAVVALTQRDRAAASWVACAPLGLAAVIRHTEDLGAPEWATLPAAVLLLAVGSRRLLRDPGLGSPRILASGLSLALVPSLALAWADPVSLRSAILGAACVLVLGASIRLRWSAPLTAAAAVGALLAARQLGPYAAALPRWISLGALGVGLLAVGVTWEARLADLRRAGRYLTGLR